MEEKTKTKDDGLTIKMENDGNGEEEAGDDEDEEEEDFEGIVFPATSPISNISSSSGMRNRNQ